MRFAGHHALALLCALGAASSVLAFPWPFDTRFPDGRYRIQTIGPAAAPTREICLRSPGDLVYFVHGHSRCQPRLVQSAERQLVVDYLCASGAGRTELRHQAPGRYTLVAQGYRGKTPYFSRLDVQRTGACAAPIGDVAKR